MRLTTKQLHVQVEEQFTLMSTRLDRQERNYDELHNRIDKSLINSENFRKEMNSEFAEIRSEFSEWRTEFREWRTEFKEMRSEMRSEFREIRNEIVFLTQAINHSFTQVEHRLRRLEERDALG